MLIIQINTSFIIRSSGYYLASGKEKKKLVDLRRFITCRSVCWHQRQTWRGFDLQWHNSVRGNNSWIWTMWRAEGKQVELIHSWWPQQSRTNQDIKLQKKNWVEPISALQPVEVVLSPWTLWIKQEWGPFGWKTRVELFFRAFLWSMLCAFLKSLRKVEGSRT